MADDEIISNIMVSFGFFTYMFDILWYFEYETFPIWMLVLSVIGVVVLAIGVHLKTKRMIAVSTWVG